MNKHEDWEWTTGEKISLLKESTFSGEWVTDNERTNTELNQKSTELNDPKMNAKLAADYIFVIEEGIKHKNIINKFEDWLISTMNNLEAENSTSKNHNMNTRHK